MNFINKIDPQARFDFFLYSDITGYAVIHDLIYRLILLQSLWNKFFEIMPSGLPRLFSMRILPSEVLSFLSVKWTVMDFSA